MGLKHLIVFPWRFAQLIFWSRAWAFAHVLRGFLQRDTVMRALWSDRQNCSHNVSQKFERIRPLSQSRKNHDSHRRDRIWRDFLHWIFRYFLHFFWGLVLLNCTEILEKKQKNPVESLQWRRRPEIADFCPLSWSNLSWHLKKTRILHPNLLDWHVVGSNIRSWQTSTSSCRRYLILRDWSRFSVPSLINLCCECGGSQTARFCTIWIHFRILHMARVLTACGRRTAIQVSHSKKKPDNPYTLN